MQEQKIQAGDVVSLKSSTIKMTVGEIKPAGAAMGESFPESAVCWYWEEGKILKETTVPVVALQKAK